MSDKPNNPFQFWQELKRRKVIRVIPVYAAAAFILLELVDIITEPFGLPDWTLKLVVVLLSIGFIISIILSWVYDVTPEGVKKTKPATQVRSEVKQAIPRGWKVSTYISVLIIIAFVVFYIISSIKQSSDISTLEKSIAVLPFENWNSDEEYAHMGDAIANEINTQLVKIKEFHVFSFTSTSQYKGSDKPSIPVIGMELGANFIIEGTVERQKENVSIHVQVIKAESDDHLWAEEFKGKWEDIFTIRAKIAIKIAEELKAILSPEEVELIEKIPTTNLTAYDYYLRGRDFYIDYLLDNNNQSAEKAIVLFQTALEIDSAFGQAYAGLAMTHFSMHSSQSMSGAQYSATYFEVEFLDSVLFLANLALSFDDQIEEGYYVRGLYYIETGNLTEALINYKNAISINPNYTMALRSIGTLYGQLGDHINALSNLHKAAILDRSSLLPVILLDLANEYWFLGFNDKSESYHQELTSLTGDSTTYYLSRWVHEFCLGNNESAFEYARAAYAFDSTDLMAIIYLGGAYLYTMHYQEAYKYYSKYYELMEKSGGLDVNDMQRIGLALWKIGKKEEAEYYFNELIRYGKESIRKRDEYGRQAAHFDLAGVYAFLGNNELAYKHLEELAQIDFQMYYYIIRMLKQQDPLFDSIREEERFQKILQIIEAKYQAEHERVRKWLEENDML